MEDGKVMIKILYEDNHVLVVIKPVNMPVCEDESKDKDLLTELKGYIKTKYNKPGNVYLGLIHRLDRPVSGVMVFAKTSKAASRISEQIRKNEMKKTYFAVVEGTMPLEGTLEDKLLKDTKLNIVKVDNKGKDSVLEYKVVKTVYNYSLVKINLRTGRSHQIRVQFSSRNHALYGDQKYNRNSKVGEQIALFAGCLSFVHPITKEIMTFSEKKPDLYPWNLFE